MVKTKDSLGDRMKGNYENRAKTYLIRRTPVIIRLDGKAFHTFTRGFKRPYDELFHQAMNNTLKYLCENIQGCKIGYTQSDEITLLLTDYDTVTTEAFFDYNVQKVCSIAASMATLMFNKYFRIAINEFFSGKTLSDDLGDYHTTMSVARDKGAMFDARCFNVPKEEVTNCFIWRQQDATRNAIQMLGQANFSHSDLQGRSCSDIQDMLMLQKDINFNDMPVAFKRGICCYKTSKGWTLDYNIPIFTQNRDYIENHIVPKETA